MLLNRKKFLIQWRKFEIKRSDNFKDMDYWIFWIFLDFLEFILFLYRFCSLLKIAKMGFISVGPWGWRCKQSWCGTGDLCGCNAARRSRGRATSAHAGSLGGLSWCGHVAGATRVHADARVVPRGRVGAGIWRAHGLVGPGYRIGTVIQ